MKSSTAHRLPSKFAYISALYSRLKSLPRSFLGIKRKRLSPVLTQPMDHILERHSWICSVLQQHLPPSNLWFGRKVCEAGAGDCLAAASMMLGLGASQVTIVEHEAPVLGSKQSEVLRHLRALGYPCDMTILNNENLLNELKCAYVSCYMENFSAGANCSLVYSICVGEHVEDLTGFFKSCYNTLSPGGEMMHYIDLGGHGIFEDPVPPLEFHRYGRLSYGAIYPKYSRATRRFVSDYTKAAFDCGFRSTRVMPMRTADSCYVKNIIPRLGSHAIAIPEEELGVIEFILYATK